jgi:hypothetical protein
VPSAAAMLSVLVIQRWGLRDGEVVAEVADLRAAVT